LTVQDEDLSDITLPDMIAEVKRELAMRERVYPGWIANGRLKQATADRDMRRMRAVLELLLDLTTQ
jgi:hypothetical protein